MNAEEKAQLLKGIIEEIASHTDYQQNNELVNAHIAKLIDIYSDGYRHSYSDLFFDVQNIIESGSEQCEILTENLKFLRDKMSSIDIEGEDYKKAQHGIVKFFDYINLEVGRYNFIKKELIDNYQISTPSSNIQDNSKMIIDIEHQVNESNRKVDISSAKVMEMAKIAENLDSKLENNKNSSLTTLTIFSAVVLAFSGGITFEAGMFKGIADSTPYRLIFAIALSGILLFNLIFMLLYIIGKITDKHIGMQCRYMKKGNEIEPCKACGDGECTKKIPSVTALCKLRNRFFYVGFVNIIFAFVLYYDFTFWIFAGWGYKFLGNIQLTDSQKLLLLILPLICFLLLVLREQLLVLMHKRRIRLHLLVAFLRGYLHKDELGMQKSMLYGFAVALSKLFKESSDEKSDQFKEVLHQIQPKKKIARKFMLKRAMRRFTKETLSYPSQLFICVDGIEHGHNRLLLRRYINELIISLNNEDEANSQKQNNEVEIPVLK